MRRRFALIAALSAVSVFLACSDLKRAEEEGTGDPDAGGTESDASGGDGGGGDGSSTDSGVDAGQPPIDFECDEPWTKATKTKPECAPRQVKEIDEGAPDMQDISIAHTSAGRVGIAFHAPFFIDEGEMRFFYFTPTTPTYTPKKIVRAGGTGYQAGFHVKLGASAPDTIHVLAHDVDSNTSGDLIHFRLVNGAEPFTANPDVVVSALQQSSEVALAVDATGNVFATARVTTGTKDGGLAIAKLVARRKQAGGAFTPLPDLATNLSPGEAPGVGAASLLFDSAGKPNVLFHYCESQTGSQPVYYAFDGTLWSSKKTVDNNTFDGHSGFSPRLAVYGSKKISAFYYRQGNVTTADLRVATWSANGDSPDIKIVDQGIPSADLLVPRYRVAMAVDAFGLVHLAVVDPTSSSSGTLDYWRETRIDGGGTKWLRDTIDDNVLSADQDALVDIVVDEKARAHIAYRSGADLKVRYATRYDR